MFSSPSSSSSTFEMSGRFTSHKKKGGGGSTPVDSSAGQRRTTRQGESSRSQGSRVDPSSQEGTDCIYKSKKRPVSSLAEPGERDRPKKPRIISSHFPRYPPNLPVWGYDNSYVGVLEVSEVERPPRDRWSRPSKPINHREHLPKGWYDQEPDLEPRFVTTKGRQ